MAGPLIQEVIVRSILILSLSVAVISLFSANVRAEGLDDMKTFDWIMGFLEEECGCFPGGVMLGESKQECKALLAKTVNSRAFGHERMIYAIIKHMKKIGALSNEQAGILNSMIPECPKK